MNIYVLDPNLKTIGLIDDYTSIIWTTRYFSNGDFELYLPANDRNILLLKENNYLCRDKDISGSRYKNVMIIEKIQITTDIESGNYLIITGRSLKSILNRRIIWQQTNLNGKAEIAIRQLITENAINPTIPERKISGLSLGDTLNLPDTIEKQITGDNLGESIEKICTSYGYGYDIDIIDNKFVFYLYKGTDRSFNQNENPYIIFSSKFENILRTEYAYDITNLGNVALVAGEGAGVDRLTHLVGDASDLDRYEKYVDARDISTNNGEYTEQEYYKLLESRGLEKLKENAVVESFSGETETRITYTLNKDYFLGDIVQVQNEYGITATPRILEIIESDSEEGTAIIPTFSTLEV